MTNQEQELYNATKKLMELCCDHDIFLTGFIFSPDLLMYFGNIKERDDELITIHKTLCGALSKIECGEETDDKKVN
jgi:hypothetical protein